LRIAIAFACEKLLVYQLNRASLSIARMLGGLINALDTPVTLRHS